MRRRATRVVAAALGGGAVLLAGLPFTGRLPFDGPVWSDEPTTEERPIRGRCRPPIVSAWRAPASDEPFWVVTVQTNMEGDSPNDLGRWCAPDARRRLLAAVGLAAAAAATARLGQRP